mgnify:FL=1
MSKLLEFNDNGERNSSILKLVDSCATKSKIKKAIEKVFDEETDVELFSF